MAKKRFYGFIHLSLPPELVELHRRRFYGVVPDHIDFIREVLQELKDSWSGGVSGLVYNGWKYFVKMGVDEEFYRFYRSLTLAERLEFNRQFVELLKKKLRVVGVEI
jgi:hypothetical protein